MRLSSNACLAGRRTSKSPMLVSCALMTPATWRIIRSKAMNLLGTAEPEPESKALVYSFRTSRRYRDRRGVFNSSGECGRAGTADTGQFGCGVDCDGGGIKVALAKDDKSILVKVERIRIWRANAPDDDPPSQAQAARAHDRLFRLDRAGLDDCKSLVTDREELATLRHK